MSQLDLRAAEAAVLEQPNAAPNSATTPSSIRPQRQPLPGQVDNRDAATNGGGTANQVSVMSSSYHQSSGELEKTRTDLARKRRTLALRRRDTGGAAASADALDETSELVAGRPKMQLGAQKNWTRLKLQVKTGLMMKEDLDDIRNSAFVHCALVFLSQQH